MTVLAVLEILAGVLFIGLAVQQFAELPTVSVGSMPISGVLVDLNLLRYAGVVIVLVLAILGIISFVLAYGLWNAKGWTWTMPIMLVIISVILSPFMPAPSVVSFIINVLIIGYLTRPDVKAFFGKTQRRPWWGYRDEALENLRVRYARGEITKEQYLEMKKVLEER